MKKKHRHRKKKPPPDHGGNKTGKPAVEPGEGGRNREKKPPPDHGGNKTGKPAVEPGEGGRSSNNTPEKKESKVLQLIIAVLIAFVGGIATDIVAFIWRTVDIEVINQEDELITKDVAVYYKNAKREPSTTDHFVELTMPRFPKQKLTVSAYGYKPENQTVDWYVDSSFTVRMTAAEGEIPFILNTKNFDLWNGQELNAKHLGKSALLLNGDFSGAVGWAVTGAALAGKTLILDIDNINESDFHENKLLKMTVNRNDITLRPEGVELVSGEYIPPRTGRVYYRLPEDFDGKLGFVFYHARLDDLIIIAWYQD
jgi:hypothetical protein